MKELKVTVKIRNNLLLSMMESFGLSSIPKAASEIGIDYRELLRLINMELSAYSKQLKDYRPSVYKLCSHFYCAVEDIFPSNVLLDSIQSKFETDLNFEDLCPLYAGLEPPKTPDEEYEKTELHDIIEEIMDGFTDRQRLIISLRYGIGKNGREMTLEEVGKVVGRPTMVSSRIEKEVFRNIRYAVMRRNDHPLREFVNN